MSFNARAVALSVCALTAWLVTITATLFATFSEGGDLILAPALTALCLALALGSFILGIFAIVSINRPEVNAWLVFAATLATLLPFLLFAAAVALS